MCLLALVHFFATISLSLALLLGVLCHYLQGNLKWMSGAPDHSDLWLDEFRIGRPPSFNPILVGHRWGPLIDIPKWWNPPGSPTTTIGRTSLKAWSLRLLKRAAMTRGGCPQIDMCIASLWKTEVLCFVLSGSLETSLSCPAFGRSEWAKKINNVYSNAYRRVESKMSGSRRSLEQVKDRLLATLPADT